MRGTQQMKILQERLNQKEEDLKVLQAEIALLKSLIAEATGAPLPDAKRSRSPRSSVKNLVLKMLEDVKQDGLNAALAVEMAAAAGTELDRGSVSSLLSRLRDQGVVAYDGKVYRLKQFVAPPPPPTHTAYESATVFHHPSSKAAS